MRTNLAVLDPASAKRVGRHGHPHLEQSVESVDAGAVAPAPPRAFAGAVPALSSEKVPTAFQGKGKPDLNPASGFDVQVAAVQSMRSATLKSLVGKAPPPLGEISGPLRDRIAAFRESNAGRLIVGKPPFGGARLLNALAGLAMNPIGRHLSPPPGCT